jgi:hypothetical protein
MGNRDPGRRYVRAAVHVQRRPYGTRGIGAVRMETLSRGSNCLAIVLAFVVIGICAPAQVDANHGVKVFPGMEIHQGSTICTLGFVEVRLGIALTTGRCDGGPVVTDSNRDVVGAVYLARHNPADDAAVDGSMSGVEYEVIRLASNVIASDRLPTGRQLESMPGLPAQPALPVCHFGISTGQTCGRGSSVGDVGLDIPGTSTGRHDIGGPVYALTDDNRAVIVGLFDGMWRSVPEAESWQAIMHQLYVDLRSFPSQQPVSAVRMVSRVQRDDALQIYPSTA